MQTAKHWVTVKKQMNLQNKLNRQEFIPAKYVIYANIRKAASMFGALLGTDGFNIIGEVSKKRRKKKRNDERRLSESA